MDTDTFDRCSSVSEVDRKIPISAIYGQKWKLVRGVRGNNAVKQRNSFFPLIKMLIKFVLTPEPRHLISVHSDYFHFIKQLIFSLAINYLYHIVPLPNGQTTK